MSPQRWWLEGFRAGFASGLAVGLAFVLVAWAFGAR